MITKITIDDVASFKSSENLSTDKPFNLIYGLNGTGKSTISNFLYHPDSSEFSKCNLEKGDEDEILVYNQQFIRDYFWESDDLRGIFSLSKENKAAEQKIKDAEKRITKLNAELEEKKKEQESLQNELSKKKESAKSKIWGIKQNYTGGDRILEYCLEGYKNDKEKLFEYIISLDKPRGKPEKTIYNLKEDVSALKGEKAEKYDPIPKVNLKFEEIERDSIFEKEIIGSQDSPVSDLIDKLQNSDWVRQGLQYLPEKVEGNPVPCPFCQEKTITNSLINSLKEYYDEEYDKAIQHIEKLHRSLSEQIEMLPKEEDYVQRDFVKKYADKFKNYYSSLVNKLNDNSDLIAEKLREPRRKIELYKTSKVLRELNSFINSINNEIKEHNQKLNNKDDELDKIKFEFWNLMRWEYDQTIQKYLDESSKLIKEVELIKSEIMLLKESIGSENDKIKKAQRETVNVEEAISNINSLLLDLGIEDFRIQKYSENAQHYRVVRTESDENIFKTLSEGEKMVISFLYFYELCKGKKTPEDTNNNRVIIIDDPVSSLSHIFVFNVAQLIRYQLSEIEQVEQIIVLTHSLYFFYELADNRKERRDQNQKLFRLQKNSNGSAILDMRYEEIQNDYQAYWQIIKDENQPPALIANSMRNIIEYFFGFVRKKDFNNVFQMEELQNQKYQAFCRYMNRESHSIGQNVFDFKEFDYETFKEGLKLVFEKTEYSEHYQAMMK